MVFSFLKACIDRGAVTAAAAGVECQGTDATVRVGASVARDAPRLAVDANPACSTRGQPPLMNLFALRLAAFGIRIHVRRVVFRPFFLD